MPTPAPSIPTTSPAAILVVEDDEVLGQVLARVLSCAGRVARHVRTATEALERVREERPRLVLVDAGLRDGTGLKLVDAIREADPHLPVIVLSAHHLENRSCPATPNGWSRSRLICPNCAAPSTPPCSSACRAARRLCVGHR
jgi:DNA-binding NtrC family response regulator